DIVLPAFVVLPTLIVLPTLVVAPTLGVAPIIHGFRGVRSVRGVGRVPRIVAGSMRSCGCLGPSGIEIAIAIRDDDEIVSAFSRSPDAGAAREHVVFHAREAVVLEGPHPSAPPTFFALPQRCSAKDPVFV